MISLKKMKFSIQISLVNVKKSLIGNFIFCAVCFMPKNYYFVRIFGHYGFMKMSQKIRIFSDV